MLVIRMVVMTGIWRMMMVIVVVMTIFGSVVMISVIGVTMTGIWSRHKHPVPNLDSMLVIRMLSGEWWSSWSS